MTDVCATPIGDEQLIAYWAHDLDEATAARVEEHLFSCDACTLACKRIAQVAEAIRTMIPPVISRNDLEALRARGLKIEENAVDVGTRKSCLFRSGVDILLHVLRGLDLSHTERVRVTVSDEISGAVIFESADAPFDRATGEILIACQRHFASFPPNVVFDVSAIDGQGGARNGRFVVPHAFE
jgi:hypothetical protein